MSSHEWPVWINGLLFPASEARVSALDHGFTVGDGAFETLCARGGFVLAPTRHWNRLVHSCEILGILPPSSDAFLQAMQQTLTASGLTDARLRFTVTSGEGPAGSARGDGTPTMTCSVSALPSLAETDRVATVPWPRNERSALTGAKTTSYAENVIALAEAKRRGAGEAIFANTRGELCEGTGSNVFLALDGDRLLTPPLSSGCLGGVTRALVIEACRAGGLPVSEEPLPLHALRNSREAFLTSTLRGVQAVTHVDDQPLSQTVGPLTRRAADLYRELVCQQNDP